jgi:tetratricopeptide (TPR) repeat protein
MHTGQLLLDGGRVDEARAQLEQALVLSRALSLRSMEGLVQSRRGELLLGQGRLAEARATLSEGEASLREHGDSEQLAELLCVRGQLDIAEQDVDGARHALAEAEASPAAADAGPGTRLSRGIATLREALATR